MVFSLTTSIFAISADSGQDIFDTIGVTRLTNSNVEFSHNRVVVLNLERGCTDMEEHASIIDVRQFPSAAKHRVIFTVWDALLTSTSMLIINDHDPKPLYYQLAAEYPDQFDWSYLESGPETWQVVIRKGKALDIKPTVSQEG